MCWSCRNALPGWATASTSSRAVSRTSRPRSRSSDRVRILRFPCGGKDFIPKEVLCDSIPEWVTNVERYVRSKRLRYAFINSHYWDAGLAGQALANRLEIPHVHTPHSIGAWKRDNMDGDPEELEQKYNFRQRVREEKVVYDECDLVIATTPPQRDILTNGEYDVPPQKIKVIPPGLRRHPVLPRFAGLAKSPEGGTEDRRSHRAGPGPDGQEQGLRPVAAGHARRVRATRRRQAAAGRRLHRTQRIGNRPGRGTQEIGRATWASPNG